MCICQLFFSVNPLQNFTYKMHCDMRRYFYTLALSMWNKDKTFNKGSSWVLCESVDLGSLLTLFAVLCSKSSSMSSLFISLFSPKSTLTVVADKTNQTCMTQFSLIFKALKEECENFGSQYLRLFVGSDLVLTFPFMISTQIIQRSNAFPVGIWIPIIFPIDFELL